MEISSIKVNGCEVQVIFNGGTYLFHNDFYGWIAQAQRNIQDREHFTLYTGNSNCIGGQMWNAIKPAAKRFIRKSEKYITKNINFVEVEKDLSKLRVSLNITEY